MALGYKFPRDLLVEMWIGNVWVDVTNYVSQDAPITIQRGRSDEQTAAAPSTMTLTLNDLAGDFLNDNPAGAWYGKLGANTPIRLSLRVGEDKFGRTLSGEWGVATDGVKWIHSVGTGTSSVSGTDAIHDLTGKGTYMYGRRGGQLLTNPRIQFDYTPQFSTVTGGDWEPANILYRFQDLSNFMLARILVTTAGEIKMRLFRRRNGVETQIGSTLTRTGLTHTAGQTWRVIFQAEGATAFFKVGLASSPEFYKWNLIESEFDEYRGFYGPGEVAIRTGAASGNTNATPTRAVYSNFSITDVRAHMEISEMSPDWDESHKYRTVKIKASDILRRLRQGTSVKSAYRRAIETDTSYTQAVDYWPCEEQGDYVQNFVNTVPNRSMMGIDFSKGTPKIGASSDIVSSEPLPVLNKSIWNGRIGPYTPGLVTGNDGTMIRFLMSVPQNGDETAVWQEVMLRVHSDGSGGFGFFDLEYKFDDPLLADYQGYFQMKVYDKFGNLVDTSTMTAGSGKGDGVNGNPRRVQVEFATASLTDMRFTVSTVRTSGGLQLGWQGTRIISGIRPLGINAVTVNPYGTLINTAIGHVSVHPNISSLFDQNLQMNAFNGERARDRWMRLCSESGVPYMTYDSVYDSPVMGVVLPDTALTQMQECVDTDQGYMGGMRTFLGLGYRERLSMYSQEAAVTLDYSARQVAAPLRPASDDLGTMNDITAKNRSGGEYRLQQLTGPKNVQDPWVSTTAAGRYEKSVTVNLRSDAELQGVAGHLRALGTAEDTRYPQIKVDLDNPEISVDLQQRLLALDMGDRIEVTNLQSALIFKPIDQIVRGTVETISDRFSHSISITSTPAAPYRVGLVETTARFFGEITLSAAVDRTTTSLPISSPTAPFTTNAADFPQDLYVNGEKVTATACAAGVLTVIRGVNGFTRAHASGSTVELDKPTVFGR